MLFEMGVKLLHRECELKGKSSVDNVTRAKLVVIVMDLCAWPGIWVWGTFWW